MADRILVTGADGFIGSHLVERLVADGRNVRAFVFYNSFGSWGWLDQAKPEIRNNLEVIAGDIRDPYRVECAMDGCDTVFHLASLIAIPFSYTSPDSYIDTNVKGTLNVIQAAKKLEVSKVIHTSTSEVYGTAQSVPISESHPLQGQSPYAASKIGADQLAMSFFLSFGTPVAIIRPFNTFGPRQSARAVIPTVITQMIGGNGKIRLGSLHPTRDFSFIEDSINAFLAIEGSERSVGEVINVGSGFEISIKDMVETVADIVGVEPNIKSENERRRPAHSEVERLVADNSKARDLIGWTPAYTGLEGFKLGIAKTVDWFREPENFARYDTKRYSI